jgi:hypothetical protein
MGAGSLRPHECTFWDSHVIHGKEKRTDGTETVSGWYGKQPAEAAC